MQILKILWYASLTLPGGKVNKNAQLIQTVVNDLH